MWCHAPSEIIFIIWTSNIIFSTIHTVFCSGFGLCLLHSDVPLLVRGLVSSHLKHVTRYSSSSRFFPLQVIVKHQMFEKVAYLPLSLFRVEKYWKNFCFRILWHRYHCNLKQEKKIRNSYIQNENCILMDTLIKSSRMSTRNNQLFWDRFPKRTHRSKQWTYYFRYETKCLQCMIFNNCWKNFFASH